MKRAYISHIGHSYVCKSKVETAVYVFLSANDRVFFEDLDQFKSAITTGISQINNGFPRNKPVEVSWYTGYGLKKCDDWSLQVSGICTFHIYEVLIKRR